MKKELHIFFTALMFYTRIPCPKNIDHNSDYLNKASRYFPLIGWIVGTISFIVYDVSVGVFTPEIAIVLSMIAGILTTGAFHEDGFADVCDGFGGGWTKEKILVIMKDSAIGAYGAIGLVLLFLLKFQAVSEVLSPSSAKNLLLFVAAHSVSRLAAISIVFTHQYSREDASSKSKPIAQSYSWREVIGAFFFGLLPLIVLSFFHWQMLLVLVPVFITRFFLARYFHKWIDGYTGDCLGATQQVCEIIFYLSSIALWKFI
ncbi:adenosylcobinamide-GDP ribazoletransferase [Flavobacterium sp. GSP27]|uniref:adenosylcobinamide-GDP ribazoletransferase n=1 Tax=unclassified Flavobacterium TaxID=196869 RepID=UPI000F8319F1|nr:MULTISPECIES: adenosylcobinamide-GDP ribazoletransferase [unclassified Flavobacterium]RTY68342.1 adenosylcobinamide-GDP ribazoletransferase [Flavobacterium sp. LB2P53]RTY80864.1 adenosylcobinamide-GDP ribazoletransferase [Flavobacterium sp. ZB4P23]RTY87036.1 adenosylcobinamide-GDP ribazoletransferase [Flavobacterium sp. GSN2]RTZ04954.1 adenosylcobinamide-GDP ribazoletransferase [Flavobacterium sp. GSP27]